MKTSFKYTFGAEIEKPVTNLKTGLTHKTSQVFFQRLKNHAEKRGTLREVHKSDLKPDVSLGILSNDLGEQGLDNGFNLLETALPYQKSLTKLQELMILDLSTVQNGLEVEGASVVNLSIHPLGKRDYKSYNFYVAPKGVYPYIWYRGWDHTAGIDARAQNSPTTGISIWEAADAVSVIIGSGAAFIGLYANSPFEEGRRSKFKEARLTMWERMMHYSKIQGDRITSRFPPKRFRTLAQYFNWMFGAKTGIHFVLADNKEGRNDYKGVGDRILLIQDTPSIIEFLSKDAWQAVFLKNLQNDFPPRNVVMVKPDISHMETMQFAQFAGARVRYGLKNHDSFPTQEFVRACKSDPNSKKVEEIFSQHTQYVYIEGRDAGANFPDQEIVENGKEIADSVVISPSAIQAGLIKNLKEAVKFIDGFAWRQLDNLRTAAIKDGLQGEVDGVSVYEFTKNIFEIASRGLTNEEHKLLNYPQWVLRTKQNGADRAIYFVEQYKGSVQDALSQLVKNRSIVISS